MRRRMLCTIGILLFCIFTVSCKKSEGRDESTDQDTENSKESETPPLVPDENQLDLQAYKDMNTFALELDSDQDQISQEGEEILKANNDPTNDTLASNSIKLMNLILENDSTAKLREELDLLAAGSVIDTEGVSKKDTNLLFYANKISDQVRERIVGKSYGKNCDVPMEELRYIRVLHQGFDDAVHIGELIVDKSVAEDIVEIFRELYWLNYPIERMILVDEYDADDNASMAANNTSAFNYRRVDRSQTISKHSYGLAIDINPLYNPYVRTIDGEQVVLPEKGEEFVDRDKDNPYYIKKGDACWEAFDKRGFTWGGSWKNKKDYQHFEKSKPEED